MNNDLKIWIYGLGIVCVVIILGIIIADIILKVIL